MYQNYIFDLYGTLVDIHTNEKKPYLWQKMSDLFAAFSAPYASPSECKAAYFATIQQLEKAAGRPNSEIRIENVFSLMLTKKGAVVKDEYIFTIANMFRILSRDTLRLYPGVMDFLSALKQSGRQIFLLSNAQRIFTEPEMRLLHLLPYFDGIFYSSDYGVKKPSPDFLEKLLQTFHLDRKKSIMIGNDVSCDVGIANACQMDSLYIHSNISPALCGTIPASFTVMDGDFTKLTPLLLKE